MKTNDQCEHCGRVFALPVGEKYLLQVLRNYVQRFWKHDFGLSIFKILKFEGRVRVFSKEQKGLIVGLVLSRQYCLVGSITEVSSLNDWGSHFKCFFLNKMCDKHYSI